MPKRDALKKYNKPLNSHSDNVGSKKDKQKICSHSQKSSETTSNYHKWSIRICVSL